MGSLWVPVCFLRTFMIHFLSFYSVAIPNLAVTLNKVAAAWPSQPVQLFPVRFPLPTQYSQMCCTAGTE